MLGFFILHVSIFSYLLHQWSVLNQVSHGGASLTVFCESNKKGMPSCAAWSKAGSLSHDWVKKHGSQAGAAHLVEVEDDPGDVASQEDDDDAEEDERLPVVLVQLLRVRGCSSGTHHL